MKQKHEFKSIVAETLLIPLYMRAKESRRERPILNDKAAECLADSLEYDYSRFDGAKLSEVGCVVRGWYFDRAVRRFIGTHARPVVVNVGCGLDTRFQRIGGGKAVFYDMDLPEVIALRRELIPEQPGNGNRLDGRFAPATPRCRVHLHRGRRADVLLREAGEVFPARRSKPFRRGRTVVRRMWHDDEPARCET